MSLVHALLDTKHKRELFFTLLFFGFFMKEVVDNIRFLWPVSQAGQLEDLYALIPLAAHGMIGRVVFALFRAFPASVMTYGLVLLQSCSPRFLCLMGYTVYFLLAKDSSPTIQYAKKLTRMIVLAIIVSLLASLVGGAMLLRFTTYQSVLHAVKILSMILLISHGLLMSMIALALLHLMQLYYKALQYYAVEMQ